MDLLLSGRALPVRLPENGENRYIDLSELKPADCAAAR